MPRYASLIYNGYWFAPERQMLQRMIDESQRAVNGVVRLELGGAEGRVMVTAGLPQQIHCFTRACGRLRMIRAPMTRRTQMALSPNAPRLRIAGRKVEIQT